MGQIKWHMLLCIFFCTQALFAQVGSDYPMDISLSTQKNFSLSPSLPNVIQPKYNFAAFQRQYAGIFKDVYQASLYGQYNHKKSLFGLMAYTDRQGNLLKKNRIYGKYTISVPIDKKRFMFVGVYVGLVNKAIGNSTTKLQASTTVPDGGIGLGYYSLRTAAAITICQVPQAIQKPIQTEVMLRRYLSMQASSYLYQQNGMKHKMIVSGNYYSVENKSFWLINEFYIREVGFLGIGIESNSKSLFSMGLNAIRNEKEILTILFGFETSTGLIRNTGYIVNTFQIGVNYKKF